MKLALANNINLHDADVSEAELNTALLRSKERIGKFTASEFHRLMAYEGNNEFPKGAELFVMEKVSEVMTGTSSFDTDIDSPAMQRGRELEPIAIDLFENKTGLKVNFKNEDQALLEYDYWLLKNIASASILDGHVGATPDGIIDEFTNLEVKCLKTSNHLLNYIELVKNGETLKKVSKQYYWQVQGQMLLSGANKTYFVCYDDRVNDIDKQLFYVIINRDRVSQDRLIKRLMLAVKRKLEILEMLK